MNLAPTPLVGSLVRLEPLTFNHFDDLCEVGLDPLLWRWTPQILVTPDDLRAYLELAISSLAKRQELPFAIVLQESGRAIGCTRYSNIDHRNSRLEIGWTWIGARFQRSGVNTESKFLLLQHAFEVLECVRVEFKSDARNEQSRRALLGIGAKEEGILRKHMLVQGGLYRDTVYYSILDVEWPAVRQLLSGKLSSR